MPGPSTQYNPFSILEEKLDLLITICQRPAPTVEFNKEDERYLTKEEVAKIFDVMPVTIWSWEKAGFLHSYRIGNPKRFKYSEVMNAPKKIKRNAL